MEKEVWGIWFIVLVGGGWLMRLVVFVVDLVLLVGVFDVVMIV